jgi:cysteine synthase B
MISTATIPEARTSFLDYIGATPMLLSSKLSPNPAVKIYLKLEGFNASGSVKDRPALYLVRDALQSGRLKPGMTLLDATSGNYGIALAMIGRCAGYPVTIVASQSITEERKKLINFYNARAVFTESSYTKEAVEMAMRMAEKDSSYCFLYQHGSPVNTRSHYETTGVEIVQQVPDIDVLVCGFGSSGTLMGAGRRVKEHNPAARLVAMEPEPGSRIPGLRNMAEEGYVPPIFMPELLDEKVPVSQREAHQMAREVAKQEGLFVGLSAGAVVCGAVRLASRMKRGAIVAVLADAGWKYISVGICETEPAQQHA